VEDTIVAIVTALGSVGIVRLSGSRSVAIAQQVFRTKAKWESHRVLYGHVLDPVTGQLIDEALVLYMASPRSYTREDVVEFQCHGGMVVVQEILARCIKLGARLANPGEFTLRAFLHGRIDLTQAESIKDLVGAQSLHGAQLALAGLQGKLSTPLKQIRSACLDILTEIEARIDFEEDLPPLSIDAISQRLRELQARARLLLSTKERGELIRSGLKVAIVGRPNVGKSSLLNAWSRTDRAIVTDIPGHHQGHCGFPFSRGRHTHHRIRHSRHSGNDRSSGTDGDGTLPPRGSPSRSRPLGHRQQCGMDTSRPTNL
jgi:tRNA modification GTPase trmE